MTSTRTRCQIRDIPATCTCQWDYRKNPARWVRVAAGDGCVWHISTRAILAAPPPDPEPERPARSYGYSPAFGTARRTA